MTSSCRGCLVGNVKMIPITSNFQELFENLTKTKISAVKGPDTLCYICHSLLNKCIQFSELARKSENILKDLSEKGTEATHENIVKSHTVKSSLSSTSIQIVDLGDMKMRINPHPTNRDSALMAVYIEQDSTMTTPFEVKKIKEEIVAEDSMDYESSSYFEVPLIESGQVLKDELGSGFYCDLCNKIFKSKNTLSLHIKDQHQSNKCFPESTTRGDKSFNCDNCEKKFPNKTILRYHMQSHTSDKPFSCNECEKKFSYKTHLKTHRRSHSGFMPLECNVCAKQFAHKSILTIHMRTHTGEKPYACRTCGKRFVDKSHVKTHMLSHTDEKPLACSCCNKRFKLRTQLLAHTRTHTGERPYACTECDKTFAHRTHLTYHFRTHTGEKPYACDRCDKKFARKYCMTMHLRTHLRKE